MNKFIIGIATALVTALLGWIGMRFADMYLHVNDDKAHASEAELSKAKDELVKQFQQINNKLLKIETTVNTNDRTLKQIRYQFLEEKRTTVGLNNNELSDWSILKSELFPGGFPE